MKINYHVFNSLLKTPAQSPQMLENFLNERICEVDERNGDTFDVKILPDRAADMMSYYGLAREYGAYTNTPLAFSFGLLSSENEYDTGGVTINSESLLCGSMIAVSANIPEKYTPPEYIKQVLDSAGQKSVNPLVDITNYIMFMYGNPVHVYDMKRMNNKMVIRSAKKGETMETLHGESVMFHGNEIVITNGESIVSLAGIKGGITAEVHPETKSVVFEMGVFNKSRIRETVSRMRITTEASKRFVHPLPDKLPRYVVGQFIKLLDSCGFTDIRVNSFYEDKDIKKPITVSWNKIDSLLGMGISKEHAKSALESVGFLVHDIDNDTAAIIPPWHRTDIDCYEVIADEIGRFYGYDMVKGKLCDFHRTIEIGDYHTRMSFKDLFSKRGLSEIITYTFVKKGEVEVSYPMARDKGALRKELYDGFSEAMIRNKNLKDICEIDMLSCFEMGTVFTKEGEYEHIIVGVESKERNKEWKQFFENGNNHATFTPIKEQFDSGIFFIEYRITYVVGNNTSLFTKMNALSGAFIQWSLFPSIARDISLWLPPEKDSEYIKKIITNKKTILCVRGPRLIDSFEKEARTSVLFRLVFQSNERTLGHAEIDTIIYEITESLKKEGCEVR